MLCLVYQSPSDHRRLVRCDGIGRFGAPQAGLMNVLRLMSTHLCDHLFLSSQRRTLLRPRVTRLPVAHNVHMAFDSMKAACYCGSASCYELQILAHGRVLVQMHFVDFMWAHDGCTLKANTDSILIFQDQKRLHCTMRSSAGMPRGPYKRLHPSWQQAHH